MVFCSEQNHRLRAQRPDGRRGLMRHSATRPSRPHTPSPRSRARAPFCRYIARPPDLLPPAVRSGDVRTFVEQALDSGPRRGRPSSRWRPGRAQRSTCWMRAWHKGERVPGRGGICALCEVLRYRRAERPLAAVETDDPALLSQPLSPKESLACLLACRIPEHRCRSALMRVRHAASG